MSDTMENHKEVTTEQEKITVAASLMFVAWKERFVRQLSELDDEKLRVFINLHTAAEKT